MISDTTEIDYGYKSPRQGLGRLGQKHHRGFFLHSALVVDAETKSVVGLGGQELYTRSLRKLKRVRRVKARKRPTEAEVWGRVIDRVRLCRPGVTLIHVCDRGADNFDVFAHLHVKQDDWVIRAAQLRRKLRIADGTVKKLDPLLESLPVLGTYQVFVDANRNQPARWACVEVRSVAVTMLRPREGSTPFVMDRDIREIETNLVEVREVDPPAAAQPVRWVLYTSRPADDFAACLKVIEYYEQRTMVEEYHKGTKTGLQVESRQYESADRLAPVIGVICVQAVRLLQLRDVARDAPETPAEKVVPREWLTVLRKVQKRPRPIITSRDFLRALARLGGFPGRKSDGEPGWITIWRGLKTLIIAARGYRAGLKRCG